MSRIDRLDVCRKTGKFCHPDFYSAALHLKSLMKSNPRKGREDGRPLVCFRCQCCLFWHVGHRHGVLKR